MSCSTTVKNYRVYCTTGGNYETIWSSTVPTVCPSDGGPIDTSLTTIIDTVGTNIVDTGANFDAFQRLRVSQLTTQLDIKQTQNQQPLLISQVQSGSGLSTYNSGQSSTTLSTAATNDYAIAQTFIRGQYQSGKSQLIEMTFSEFQSQTNIIKRVGYFNSSTSAPYTATLDGIFMESNDTGIYFKIYRNGTEIFNVEQSEWDDPADGTQDCPALDFSQSQILLIDFQWLGVGRVKFSFFVGSILYPVYTAANANIHDVVYMATPNHSLRWEIRQSGAGSGSLTYICAAVHTEGGNNIVGRQLTVGTNQNFINANSSGTYYALVGLRLLSTSPGTKVELLSLNMAPLSNDAVFWQLRFNPTVAGTFTYNAVSGSNIEGAVGDTTNSPSTNTVTGGTILASGYINRGDASALSASFSNALRLGTSIAGTATTLVLCCTPVNGYSMLDVTGTITWFETE